LPERERLAQLAQRAMLAQAETGLQAGRYAQALSLCERLLNAEPWHEPATLIAMRACQALGNIPRALRFYQRIELGEYRPRAVLP